MMIRSLQADDNAAIEAVIRDCLIEFGGNREGLAWQDDSLSALSRYYEVEGRAYWVVEQDGRVVGGAGIAPFADSSEVCELQKCTCEAISAVQASRLVFWRHAWISRNVTTRDVIWKRCSRCRRRTAFTSNTAFSR